MLGHREMNFEDYLEILRKRWWIILIPALLGCAGVYLFSLTLADQYTSRTLVLVEQQKVPENYVKSVDASDIGERLGTMQEQILSRTRLTPIIEKFGLFKNQKGKTSTEDMVDTLRKSIQIVPIKSLVTTRDGELPGFSVSFTANDAHLAQQVCAEITSMFIEESLRLQEERSVGTTDFLKSTLDQAKQSLDAQDQKLAEFQRKFVGSLPGNEQTDMTMVTSYSSQLDAVTGQLSRAEQDKAYMESLLAQQLSAWQLSQKTSGGIGEPHQDALETQLADLQSQLVSLKAKYTADHPDVVKMEGSIAALKKRIEDNQAHAKEKTSQPNVEAGVKTPEPPAIQQLRFQIHSQDVLIKEKTGEQARLRGQLGAAQGKLSMTPAVEKEYKEITRDYQTALQFYNDTLAKKNQSEMATSLERKQQGAQFNLMDQANLPEKPSFPNRPAFAGAGLAGGLALGFGITLLLEFRDKTLRSENDIEHFLGLPTLAMVPKIVESMTNPKPGAGSGSEARARLGETAHV
ncbi:MAG TPA: Wzz/FepE/Etk N-terminal domain-containing protein [Terriglobia bacterium]|nr:Wzz/FepE/Etk N-terminal domain-containing protein [Terriglobia bacterium]